MWRLIILKLAKEAGRAVLYVGIPFIWVGMSIEGGAPPSWTYAVWSALIILTI